MILLVVDTQNLIMNNELYEFQTFVYRIKKFSVQGVQTRLKRNDRFEISDRVVN